MPERVEPAGDAVCSLCGGTGRTDFKVDRRVGYIDGAADVTNTIIVNVTGYAGFGTAHDPSNTPELFSRRQAIRDAEDIHSWPDGLLVEYVTRLRRELVMFDESEREPWWEVDVRRRYEQAASELRWRERAAQKGADPIDRSAQWRERVEAVKRDVDLIRLIVWENTKSVVHTSGRKGRCTCPFHADTNPSLDVDDEKGVWICRSCQVGGDCFTYVMLKHGMTFAEAVRYLESRLGLTKEADARS